MITLIPVENDLSIYQLNNDQEIPSQFFSSDFYSITKTDDEISIVTDLRLEMEGVKSSHGWKGFKVEGILDFALTGIINDITCPLKTGSISVFVISTFNTDYILVRKEDFSRAVELFNKTDNIRVI